MSESKLSPIAMRVIAAVLSAGVLWAIAKVPGLLRWFANTSLALWSHITSTSTIPNWVSYLLAITVIHSIVVVVRRFIKPRGPKVSEYRQDNFLGLIWRWSYTYGGHPANPWAFCPQCDTQLVYSYDYSELNQKTILTCETCTFPVLRHEGDKDYLVSKIHRQIDRKIRNGEWISVVQQSTQQAVAADRAKPRSG